MPSTNKTELVQLNQWLGNEYPKMDDFNADNLKIDNKFKEMNTEITNARNGEVSLDNRLDKNDVVVAGHTASLLDLTNKIALRPLMTTSNLTYYVDVTNGLDTNDGLSSGTGHAFKTIAKAISIIPQIVNHVVVINVASGAYSESVFISGFSGKGSISLNGGTDLATAVNYKINNLVVLRCSCGIVLTGFQSTSTSGNGFYITTCINVALNYCIDTVSATPKNGIVCDYSLVNISNCQFSNKGIAVISSNCSTVYSNTNTGSGNNYGLNAISSSTIGKNSTQPSATTAEATNSGGVIRS